MYLPDLSKEAFANHISYHQITRPEYSAWGVHDAINLIMANLGGGGVHPAHYQLLIKLYPKEENLGKNLETPTK